MNDRTLDAARRLSSWVDAHFESFRPERGTGLLRFREIKPFGELALIALALTAPAHRGELAAWGDLLASRLWHDATALPGRFPSGAGALLAFPVLEVATGRRFRFHDLVASELRHAAPSLESAFAFDLLGLGDCRGAAFAALQQHLDAARRRPSLSVLYSITHAIFYATHMGRRPMRPEPQLHTLLSQLIRDRLAHRHYDVAAELVAALAWSGGGGLPAHHEGVEALIRLAESEGSVATDFRSPAPRHHFHGRYHATIAALAALTSKEAP